MRTKILFTGTICLLCIIIGCNLKESSDSIQKEHEIEGLPEYEVLDTVQLISGEGVYADILIPSFSSETLIEVREEILKKISKKEGFVSIGLYCTQDAYKANYSSSFLDNHPNALREGYLGKLRKDGTFAKPLE